MSRFLIFRSAVFCLIAGFASARLESEAPTRSSFSASDASAEAHGFDEELLLGPVPQAINLNPLPIFALIQAIAPDAEGVPSSPASTEEVDAREIVRLAVLRALQNPSTDVERFLHRSEAHYLSDGARIIDDLKLMSFGVNVAVPCEAPSATSESCVEAIARHFDVPVEDINALLEAQTSPNTYNTLSAFLSTSLHNPSLEPLSRNLLLSPVVFEFIEYFSPDELQRILGFTFANDLSRFSLMMLCGQLYLEMNVNLNVFHDSEEFFMRSLSEISRTHDFFYRPAQAEQPPLRNSAGFSESGFFRQTALHPVKTLFEKSAELMGMFRIAEILSPFTERIMRDVPESLWVRIAPGTTPLDRELELWDKKRRAKRQAAYESEQSESQIPLPPNSEGEQEDEERTEFVRKWRQEWVEVPKVRGYRRSNAFYTWTRLYVPGELMKMQASLQTDVEYEAAIEADCREFKFPVEVTKDLLIPGRSEKGLLAHGMKAVELFLGMLKLSQDEGQRKRVLERSKTLKLVAKRMKELAKKTLEKEMEYKAKGRDLLAEYRGLEKDEENRDLEYEYRELMAEKMTVEVEDWKSEEAPNEVVFNSLLPSGGSVYLIGGSVLVLLMALVAASYKL